MGSSASKRSQLERRLAARFADQESVLAAIAANNKHQRWLLMRQAARQHQNQHQLGLVEQFSESLCYVDERKGQQQAALLCGAGSCKNVYSPSPSPSSSSPSSFLNQPVYLPEAAATAHLQPADSVRGRRRKRATPSPAQLGVRAAVPRRQHVQRERRPHSQQSQKMQPLGLSPPAQQDQQLQIAAVVAYLDKCPDELSRYVYMRNLKDFNERLFYATVMSHVEKVMPIVYTPTVGLACQMYSQIYMRPRGLFVSIRDAGRVASLLANWQEKDVRVIVVTDGERILGLGDLGANGMGISIGKLSLYTALAGIPPKNVLPVTIDVGTNNQTNLDDPFYIGLRQKRVRGQQYDQLIDEFMRAVVDRWGRSCLIQFEDFANTTAFDLLQRYRNQYCCFNDDIQGTASVCLSGLITATRMIGKRLSECQFLFHGAGEANLGTAKLLMMAMRDEGLSSDGQAKKHIWLVDSKGLVVSSRQDLTDHKRFFAQEASPIGELEQVIDQVKPAAIIGACAQGGAFTQSICAKMAQINERPIIFALSNPTSKAECTAEQAYNWTNGTCVFASGSPFEPVNYEGKTYITGQGNNVYIFPGVGLAAIAAHVHSIPEETFLVAAKALSDMVTDEDKAVGLTYPKLNRTGEVTLSLAARILEYFYAERLATYRPEPENKKEFLRSIQYNPRNPAQYSADGHEALAQLSLKGSS